MSIIEVTPPGRSGGPTATRHFLVDRMADVVAAGDFGAVLRESAVLADAARRTPDVELLVASLRLFAEHGVLTRLIAAEALAGLPHEGADATLADLLADAHPVVRRHAAWRLGSRLPIRRAYLPLLELVADGGIDTLHAHRTLRGWAASDRRLIVELAGVVLGATTEPLRRARLVDLIGAIRSDDSTDLLRRIAVDSAEADVVKIAAVGALGERDGADVDDVLGRLASSDDEVRAHARLALADRSLSGSVIDRRGDGLRIAQLVLARGLDGQLSLGGRGDIGGVASLLVSLGESLARRPEVERVLTIGRGDVTDALVSPTPSVESSVAYGVLALGDAARPADTPHEIWEQLPAIERGLRRTLRRAGPIDLLHLRMADAGTLAGFETARELGIPVCFSVAPDPHNVVESLQSRGELDAERFVELERQSDVWFRARLVEQLTLRADRLALFPRARPMEFVESIGRRSGRTDQRSAVIAEGIDLDLIDRAVTRLRSRPTATVRDVLDDVADRIPPTRRHLPLVLSVGRLHPVKGMERVVAAWAADPDLHTTSNLVVVGGDLASPSAAERDILDTIDRAVPVGDPRRAGLVLLGGRPRADVALLQVATAAGCPGYWPGGGVYVDGALKEEFGLAVIEAMASGLVVVAPSTGGPSTYVDDGATGVLVEPGADLAVAIRSSFDLVELSGRAERARRMVEDRYSIESMANRLVALYRPVAVAS